MAGRRDFRAHRSGGEAVVAHRSWVRSPEGFGGGLPPIEEHGVGIGGHQEEVGIELTREQFRADILVDDGLDTAQFAARLIDGRNAAATRRDDDRASFEKPADWPYLEDLLGLG